MEKTLFWLLFFPLGWTLLGGAERAQAPRLVRERTFPLTRPTFEARAPVLQDACGIECQRRLPAPSLADLEAALSYQTVFENGTRTLTRVRVRGLGPEPTANATAGGAPARRRRQVYGADSRFSISDRRFLASFPFSAAVKLSTGCSGVLVSPRHVLTAARCVHDGRGYVRGGERLRVGLLRASRKAGGRRRGGARRGGRRAQGGDPRGGGRASLPGRARAARRGEGKGKGKGPARGPRGAGGRPSFQWTRVQSTHVPQGWAAGGRGEAALDYDYALLELRRAHRNKYMDLGVGPALGRLPGGGRIHFSGFDRDRADQLVYRFCGVSDESRDLLYQRCDAEAGSTGSGVYLRLRAPGQKWKRQVIAVYSGHQWVDVRGERKDYNVAVRITPLKLAQICLWVHGELADCARG